MLAVVFSTVDMTGEHKDKLETLYCKYRRLLFTVIRRIVSTDSDSEDILQNTFIKIAKNIKKIDDVESRETVAFLTVIAKNTAYDFLRRQALIEEVPFEETDVIIADDKAFSELLSNLEYEKIVNCIKSITSPYMEVLYLHFVRDLSAKQIAHILERKPATVKMQLVRGKKLLVKRLSEVLYG